MIRTTLTLFVATFLAALPAAAQSSSPGEVLEGVASATDTIVTSLTREQLTRSPESHAFVVEPASPTLHSLKRRQPILTALYGSYATLQILDMHSTQRGLALGGREANPIIAPIIGNAAAVGALKIGVTALTVFATEKIRKRNRAAAVAVMIGSNAVYAFAVANNYRHGRK